MRVLLINKYHYLKGGAERAYFGMAKILVDHGHEVAFFSMAHLNNLSTAWSKYFIDEVDYESGQMSLKKKIIAAMNIFYNRQAKAQLEKLLLEFKPDVAHLHNIYHQLSPSIIDVLTKHKIPTVMTLHDYKLVCPNYSLYAHGKVWEKSKPDKYYKIFLDQAVKNSYLKSLICTLEAYLHKFLGIYNKIDFFISPSQFLIDKYKEFGFKNKIVYLPNALIKNNDEKNIAPTADKYILYFGRLSQEKGVDVLIQAYRQLKTDYKLIIAGDGPEEESCKLQVVSCKLNERVKLVGHKQGTELATLVAKAEFIVVPSRWYENAPYSVIEAMAIGKTVIASDLGGLKELIEANKTGFLFKAGDVNELAKVMNYVIANPELKNKIGAEAIRAVSLKNNSENFYNKLIEIYDKATAKNKN